MFNKINRDFYDEITKCRDIKEYMKVNSDKFIEICFTDHVRDLMQMRNITTTDLVKSSCIEKSYLYQILNGRRKPSRDKLLRIAFGLGLSLEDTQKLLVVAEKSILFPIRRRDAAIMCSRNNCESIDQVQVLLYDLGLDIID